MSSQGPGGHGAIRAINGVDFDRRPVNQPVLLFPPLSRSMTDDVTACTVRERVRSPGVRQGRASGALEMI